MSGLSRYFKKDGLLPLLVFVVAFLVHANTLGHEYALDDSIVITDNQFTTQGLEGLGDIFSKDTFYGFFKKDGKDNLVQGGRYRPLSLAMFAIEYELFGQNPFIGHLFNVVLFALLCGLILVFIRQLLKDHKHSEVLAFLAALIFAVHPVHTEVVANIKGRDEILTLLFSILSFSYVLSYVDHRKMMSLVWSGICLFLASLSKENAITFVVIIPLALYLFRDIKAKEIFKSSLPAFIGVGVFMVIRFSVLGFSLGSESLELMNNPFLKWTGNTYEAMTFMEKLPTVFYTLGAYVKLLFLPTGLTHDYYPRYIELMQWSDLVVVCSVLTYLGLGVLFFTQFKKRPVISFSIGFYLITLSIVSNVVISIGTNMAERFIFMPSLGFCLLIALLYVKSAERMKGSMVAEFTKPAYYPFYLLILVFAFGSFKRNKVWENNYALFTSDIQQSTKSAKLCTSAAGILIDTHKNDPDASKLKQLTKAKEYTEQAIQIHPTYKNAYLLRGNAAFYLKEFDESILWYERILKMDPNYENAQNNLFEAYLRGGEYAGQTENNLTKALQYLHKAESMKGNQSYEVNRLLGIAYGISQNSTQALVYFQKCVELEPDNPWSYYNLLTAYANLQNLEKVAELEQKILSMDPDFFVKLRNNNGNS